MRIVNLATEDEISELVGIRLIEEIGTDFQIGLKLRKGGSGYLRSRIQNFCEMARQSPLILITDLDRVHCAPTLISDWINNLDHPQELIFRVAVREIEAWLLADHEAIHQLLGCSKNLLPSNPDELLDPKQRLLNLAKRAPRSIRTELVSEKNAMAAQGLGYNKTLGNFIRNDWNPVRASERSESLTRARRRIRSLCKV